MTEPVAFHEGHVVLHAGDCLDVLKTLPDASIDSVVTDPPYALVSITKRFGKEGAAPAKVPEGGSGAYMRASAGFMGAKWDTGERAFAVEFWAEVFRVLKPGGHVLAFAATRTQHRLACAIEDAGFEIRDMICDLVASDTFVQGFLGSLSDEQVRAFFRCIEESGLGGLLLWAFGTGFPKSHDVSRGIDAEAACKWKGWGTALKPALEPITVARKPLAGTVAETVLAHGTGAINIDACRIRLSKGDDPRLGGNGTWTTSQVQSGDTVSLPRGEVASSPLGRHPANVVHDGSNEVLAAFTAEAGGGDLRGRGGGKRPGGFGNVGSENGSGAPCSALNSDSGSAARFFFSAKADADDRIGSKHPTVKPVDLMRWLVRLVTPPGGTCLDPFAGTGTTGEAAWREGFRAVLIEREEEYRADIARRMALTLAGPALRRAESAKARDRKPSAPMALFGEA